MIKSDNRLIELAAKAAGIHIEYFNEVGRSGAWVPETYDGNEYGPFLEWNPIVNNGDCFILETALGLSARWYLGALIPHVDVDGAMEIISDHSGDKAKARRYASTRAAAEIGSKMPDCPHPSPDKSDQLIAP